MPSSKYVCCTGYVVGWKVLPFGCAGCGCRWIACIAWRDGRAHGVWYLVAVDCWYWYAPDA